MQGLIIVFGVEVDINTYMARDCVRRQLMTKPTVHKLLLDNFDQLYNYYFLGEKLSSNNTYPDDICEHFRSTMVSSNNNDDILNIFKHSCGRPGLVIGYIVKMFDDKIECSSGISLPIINAEVNNIVDDKLFEWGLSPKELSEMGISTEKKLFFISPTCATCV